MTIGKRIQNWTMALLFVASAGGALLAVAMPSTANAACNDRLLTFPAWFRGITTPEPDCEIESPSEKGIVRFIWIIVLNIVEFMLQLVAYISVGFIITGGFKYMTSSGSPDGMTKAKRTVTNAVVGLIIAIFSVAIVNIVADAL